jgi:hypothetical protein
MATADTGGYMKIFISHATADKELAEKLVDLLRLGAGLSHDDIFFSSRDGDIPNGEFFVQHILNQLNEAKLVFCLVSESYFESKFCQAEAGAALARKTAGAAGFHALAVPPVRFPDLDGILYGVQSGYVDDPRALDALRDVIGSMAKPLPTATWESKRESFLKDAREIIKNRWRSPAAFLPERLSKVQSNPRYADDAVRFDKFYKKDSITSKESVIIVVGTTVAGDLLDRCVACALRDLIDEKGEGIPFRRGIVLADVCWLSEKGLANNPVIAVGGPPANRVTAEFEKWAPPPGSRQGKYSVPGAPGLMGFFRTNEADLPQVARWGPSATGTREAVQRYVENPQGLAEFLKISTWT